MQGQRWFKISDVHRMPPFFMTGVSSGDHWMFLSSCGALRAGRRNPESALFPYCSSEKTLDLAHCTGPKTLIRVSADSSTDLLGADRHPWWERFSSPPRAV